MGRNNTLSKEIMASTPPVFHKRIKTRMLVAKMIHDYLNTWEISQQELARRMGKRPSEISKWLSGNHNLTIDTLSDIGYYLDTDFLIQRSETAYIRCLHSQQISRPNTKTRKFGTTLNGFFSVDDYSPNYKKLKKCLA